MYQKLMRKYEIGIEKMNELDFQKLTDFKSMNEYQNTTFARKIRFFGGRRFVGLV